MPKLNKKQKHIAEMLGSNRIIAMPKGRFKGPADCLGLRKPKEPKK